MQAQINTADFDLAASLESGQAFRWRREPEGWFRGVVGRHVWRLRQQGPTLEYSCNPSCPTLSRLAAVGHARAFPIPHSPSPIRHYLSLDRSLPAITATFPDEDAALQAAVRQHWGLRVLRQEPWECLASFIASSTKQIVQIRQIVDLLARRFGEPIEPPGGGIDYAFPSVTTIARASQSQLWDCKLGFRAKYLLEAARLIDRGRVHLGGLPTMELDRAVEELVKLPGVGEKIAACTLLFSCGLDRAFPVDVWMERALRRIYFPGQRVTARQLREFAARHFGPHAGWAQQYLFFDERTARRRTRSTVGAT